MGDTASHASLLILQRSVREDAIFNERARIGRRAPLGKNDCTRWQRDSDNNIKSYIDVERMLSTTNAAKADNGIFAYVYTQP